MKRLLSSGSFLGRWHADRSLGVDEEFSAERRIGRPAAVRRRGGQPRGGFPWSEALRHETHASTTDPEARLYRKGPGKEAKLCLMGHALMENRNGLVVDARLTEANGHAERIAALHMIPSRAPIGRTPVTLGADKAYDTEDFVNELRSMNATAHVAQNTNGRSSAIDGRTTRHAGYAVSQRIRKRIEEAFGWIKKGGGQERTKFRGRERVGWAFTLAAAAYNLARLPKLLADRRFRSLGSSSSPSERPGDADDHRARRRNRLRRLGGRPRSRIRPRLDRFPLGRMRGRR